MTISSAPKQSDSAPKRPDDPNVDLMLQFQQGDESAFEKLVERNVNTIHALVYRFLREPSQIEDITQEVFLRIYRNAPRYQPTAKFSTWLYRIVANLCFNVIRSRKKANPSSLDAAGNDETRRDVPDPRCPEPSALMAKHELSEEIAKAVAELPENQRLAIVLNKFEDKNYEEIAEVLQTTTMAVKSLLSRARGKLRESLQRHMNKHR